jgi:DNA helicase-2/ATP-dependent DNA helicase PcrA
MYGRTLPSSPSLFLHEVDKSGLQTNRSAAKPALFTAFQRPIASANANQYVSAANRELEERAGWKRGQRLFHENHGYGAVMEVKDSEDGPVVRVRFDNGEETRFLSEYQGRAFEKMGDDY